MPKSVYEAALNPDLADLSAKKAGEGDYAAALILGLLAFLLAASQAGFSLVKYISALKSKQVSDSGKMHALDLAENPTKYPHKQTRLSVILDEINAELALLKSRVSALEGDDTETLREMHKTLGEFIAKAGGNNGGNGGSNSANKRAK